MKLPLRYKFNGAIVLIFVLIAVIFSGLLFPLHQQRVSSVVLVGSVLGATLVVMLVVLNLFISRMLIRQEALQKAHDELKRQVDELTKNARQIQRTENALHETQLLYRVSRILAKTADMQKGIEQAQGEYLQFLKLKQGGISLFNQDKQCGILYVLYVTEY